MFGHSNLKGSVVVTGVIPLAGDADHVVHFDAFVAI